MRLPRPLFALSLALTATLTATLIGATLPGTADAAEGRITVVQQFGTTYLPLHVIRDRKLIEKHGKAQGFDIEVYWKRLSGGAAINEAILSGAVDVGAGGIAPFLILWDRTRGNADVKIVGALGEQDNHLITNNPKVKTIEDFTPADRIALPAVGVSLQARLLQMEAEKVFGEGEHAALDKLTTSLPHPDATAALLSGSTEITAHFSNPPYQDQELENPKIHRVLSASDVLGGPATGTLLYATSKFRRDNPKTFRAFFDALGDAAAWIEANKAEAAETYVRVEQSKLDPAFVEKVISAPGVRFTTTPSSTYKFASFLHRIGSLKNKPATWKDYTFEELHGQPGS